MSRGIEIIETVFDTGSSETTIIVSVRYVFRPTPESTPMIRPVTRGTVGLADGDAEASGDPARQRRRGRQVLGVRFRAERRHGGDRGGVLEDLVGGLADGLGRVAAIGLGNDDDEQDERDRQHVPAAGSRQRRVVQAGPDGEEAPHEEDALEGEQRPDDVRVDELRDEPWARCREHDPQHGHQGDDGGCQEQRGQPASPGDEVAEPGDQRIEDGRDVARSGSGRLAGSVRSARVAGVGGRDRIRPLFIHGRQGSRPWPLVAPSGPARPSSGIIPAGPAGEWPNGKAPDSGSGDSRFESLLASQPTRTPPTRAAIHRFAGPPTPSHESGAAST